MPREGVAARMRVRDRAAGLEAGMVSGVGLEDGCGGWVAVVWEVEGGGSDIAGRVKVWECEGREWRMGPGICMCGAWTAGLQNALRGDAGERDLGLSSLDWTN